MIDAIDQALLDAQRTLRETEAEMEAAKDHRAMAFALAAEKGKTSGDIARLTGAPPQSVLYAIKTGGRLIRRRRWLAQEREAA